MNEFANNLRSIPSVKDAQEFLAQHGDSLSDVLLAAAGEAGGEIFRELKKSLGEMPADREKINWAVCNLRDQLSNAGCVSDLHEASLRWHGARLAEIAYRLRM